jgi:hypothetical protein
MATKENVLKAHTVFWEPLEKPQHPDDLKLGKDIRDNHILRAEGKIPGEVLAKEVAGWIAATTGEHL